MSTIGGRETWSLAGETFTGEVLAGCEEKPFESVAPEDDRQPRVLLYISSRVTPGDSWVPVEVLVWRRCNSCPVTTDRCAPTDVSHPRGPHTQAYPVTEKIVIDSKNDSDWRRYVSYALSLFVY